VETSRRNPVLGPIRLLFEVGTVAGMSDGQLLERFLARRELGIEAAEIAFAALVERHGAMVLQVCRGRLRDEHDAQDAFQATFLILARNAGSIRKHESAASWLNGVARRVASCARRSAALRRAKERQAAGRRAEAVAESDHAELVPAVREEVGDLPEKYRTPLMLCLLDGLTHEEAATRLGWPVGTVKTRVRHAKDRLRTRLARRGFAPSMGVIAASLAAQEATAMPALLVRATARAAIRWEMGRSLATLSSSVANLVELGMGSLIMTRWKIAALVMTSLGLFAAGAAGYARQGPGPRDRKEVVEPQPIAQKETAVDPRPVAAAVAEDDVLDQLELAKVDIEVQRAKVDGQRNQIINLLQSSSNQASSIKSIQETKNLEELRNYGPITANEAFEPARKRIEEGWQETLNTYRESLKKSRNTYVEISRNLRHEEQRIQEMEEQSARLKAKRSNASAKPAATDTAQLDLLDQAKLAKIKVDVLRMDAERCQTWLNSAHENVRETRQRTRLYRRPKGATALEDQNTRELLEMQLQDADRDLQNVTKLYEKTCAELIVGERNLRELAKDLPWSLQAGVLPTEAKPNADVDRRLGSVEKKLDLILKTLEAKPAGQ
jgi:RNA polymerase sigma factor (sigma-70 family)